MTENGASSANSHKLPKGIVIGMAGGVILLFALGLWFLMNNQSIPSAYGGLVEAEFQENKEDVIYEETGGTRIPTASERLEQRYDIDRNGYRIYLDSYGYDTFEALPEIPDDFGTIAYMIHTGKLFSFDKVTKEYYLQPEFFPLFIDNGLKFYEYHNPKYVGTYGWGTYPSEQTVYTPVGGEGKVEFFFKTGWGIETWQGINLVAMPRCDWITAEVENPIFVTPPSYPEFCTEEKCGEDWARKVTIKGRIDANVASGSKCDIELTSIAPPISKVREWIDKYRTDYVTASASMVTTGVPFVAHVIVN